MLERRSFLRGLVTLPLIGGSVALIGDPTAAAVPMTDALHARYLAWLAHEHWAAQREYNWRQAAAAWRPGIDTYDPTAAAYADRVATYNPHPNWWIPDAPDVGRAVASAPASTRAAVILSAAGVPLVGGAS